MAPVKDWTSNVGRFFQVKKHGFESTKKHYEREAVSKYIFNKFGVHLLTFNHQTRHEVIPMFGEHGRSTTANIFEGRKHLLQNRKDSAMRSHLATLKRDLKKNNLPMPAQLKGVEAEKFVRKRVDEDMYCAQERRADRQTKGSRAARFDRNAEEHERDFMNNYMTLSPRSGSPNSLLQGSRTRSLSLGAGSPKYRDRPAQLLSHR